MEAIQPTNEGQISYLLQTLQAAGLPLTEILVQAERMGISPDEQIRFAARMIPSLFEFPPEEHPEHRDHHLLLAQVMVFGYSHPSPSKLLRICDPTMDPPFLLIHASSERLTGSALGTEHFVSKVLRTAGYPPSILDHLGSTVTSSPDAQPWLDSGRTFHHGIDLSHYRTDAHSWFTVTGQPLLLKDGLGPEILARTIGGIHDVSPGFPPTWNQDSVRLVRVSGLRHIQGLSEHSTRLVAMDCRELATIDRAPEILILIHCPAMTSLPSLESSYRLLHVERCSGLRSLTGEGEEALTVSGPAILADCPEVSRFPARLKVGGHLVLRRMGPVLKWPDRFSVGGDLVLRNCLAVTELPPVEVSGSVRIEGGSSLRRLAAGSVIGRHLDLRHCSHLEGLPRGIQVGGKIFLPPHLHREPSGHFEDPVPLFAEPRDLYPDLHTLLLGFQFQELVSPGDRKDLSTRSERVLKAFRAELRECPRLEIELLWIASEVWSDLAEARWERGLRHDLNQDGADDLPVAWFRNLLHRSDPDVSWRAVV